MPKNNLLFEIYQVAYLVKNDWHYNGYYWTKKGLTQRCVFGTSPCTCHKDKTCLFNLDEAYYFQLEE